MYLEVIVITTRRDIGDEICCRQSRRRELRRKESRHENHYGIQARVENALVIIHYKKTSQRGREKVKKREERREGTEREGESHESKVEREERGRWSATRLFLA